MTRYMPRHLVPSHVLVSAIRYGMGRMTYADSDARDLIRVHWADMHETDQQVIREDITAHVRFCGAHLSEKWSGNSRRYREQYGRWRYLLEHLDDEKMPAEPLGTPIYEEMNDA